MFAIVTSMLRTAPAEAGFADGVVLSAIPADMTVGVARHVQNALDGKRFCHRPYSPTLGSEGARVM
jgi:hypothetical protein